MTTPLSADNFAAALQTFIADEVSLTDDPVTDSTDLLLSGMVDSLGVIMISTWIQDQLSIEIDPVDVVLENFQTITQMVAYVASRDAVTR